MRRQAVTPRHGRPDRLRLFFGLQPYLRLRFQIWLDDFSLKLRGFIPPISHFLTTYYL
nr:MAG TPA: hypothetical protein [Caudoviricetes sp.]